MRSVLFSLGVLFLAKFSFGQIQVDDTPTAVQLVQNTLIGNGVSASNITFSGGATQSGTFNAGTSNIGLPFGVVLGSGNVGDCVPPNQPSNGQFNGAGDPDLVTVAQSVTSNPQSGMINTTFDAAVLEFDFVPIGDTVSFNFVFASEEYTTYINTQYNDAFGFFLSGPGYTGPFASPAAFPNGAVNLAQVPGTTDPITISTIHPGLNATYYVGTPIDHSFNGFTIPITIEFPVQCGQTYHFKFAVADCQDDFLDTSVFLEGQSFSSDGVQVSVATVTGDTVIHEGCSTADFVFTRPDTTDTLIIDYNLTGTAIEGSDYNNLPDSVVFLPGQDTIILTMIPTVDGISEPWGEDVIITAYTISPCGDTIASVGTLWILDEPDVQIDETDSLLLCPTDSILVSALASGGLQPYTWSWTGNSSTTQDAWVDATTIGSVDYYVTVTDDCGYSADDTITVTVSPTISIDSLIPTASSPCYDDGSIDTYVSGTSGSETYSWSNTNATLTNNTANWTGIPSDWYYLTLTDGTCVISDSVQVPELPQALQIDDMPMTPSATCLATGAVNSVISGEIGTATYSWTSPQPNNPASVTTPDWTNVLPGWYYLTITDGNCTYTDSVEVTLEAAPVASFTATPEDGCVPLEVVFVNNSLNAQTFEWDFGNSTIVNASDLSGQLQTFTNSSTVQLVAFDQYNCSDTTTVDITVIPCGCTDSIATNYNPLATVDDGSCIYPNPTVVCPNVFTPNGDQTNDVFFLHITNYSFVEFRIMNRWGNEMYYGTGSPAAPASWDGRSKNGSEVSEGTYFIIYTVTGVDGTTTVEGHNSVQVVR